MTKLSWSMQGLQWCIQRPLKSRKAPIRVTQLAYGWMPPLSRVRERQKEAQTHQIDIVLSDFNTQLGLQIEAARPFPQLRSCCRQETLGRDCNRGTLAEGVLLLFHQLMIKGTHNYGLASLQRRGWPHQNVPHWHLHVCPVYWQGKFIIKPAHWCEVFAFRLHFIVSLYSALLGGDFHTQVDSLNSFHSSIANNS